MYHSSSLVLTLFAALLTAQTTQAAKVSVDKNVYCRGDDEIQIHFQDVEGVGVWIGLFPREAIPTSIDNDTSTPQLPSFHSGALTQWLLTCGRRDGCDMWPTEGSISLPTFDVAANDYVVAVSGDRASFSAQAVSSTIKVTECTPSSAPSFRSALTETPSRLPSSNPSTTAPSARPSLPQSPFPSFAPSPPSMDGIVMSDDWKEIMTEARADIAELIRNDEDLIGKFLRLVFHDCVGGCNGCVDMTNPDNAGLEKPIRALQPIVERNEGGILTRTDIWALSALVATKEALPFAQRNLEFSTQWVGRRTCESFGDCGLDFEGNPAECTMLRGPHVELCHGTAGTDTVQKFFENEFAFDPQQTTAIMGAHSVGKMSRNNVGFSGIWDFSTTVLDNGYWSELVVGPEFELTTVNNDDLLGVPSRLQWEGDLENVQLRVAMMNSDIALVRNIGDAESVECTFQHGDNACSRDTPFIQHAEKYASSAETFLVDFRDVMTLLINHKHEKPLEPCPDSKLCSFGFHPSHFSLPAPIEPPSPFPTIVPAVIPVSEAGNGEATIRVGKICYDRGEALTATFERVSGEGIFIGFYLKENVQSFRALPELEDGFLINWVLSCNSKDECDEWPTQGTVQFENMLLERGDYVLAVSGPGGSTEGQASVDFRISC